MNIHYEIEEKDILDSVKVHPNGCAFKLIHKKEFTGLFIGYGCYCLINLLQGFELYLHRKLIRNNDEPIPISDLIKITPDFSLKLAELMMLNSIHKCYTQ